MKVKLWHGDCLELMKDIPDNCIDMVLTSPPYDDLRDYNNTLYWDFNIFKFIAIELYRVLKNGGVIIWIVNDQTKKGSETGTSFKQALYFKEIGLNLHDTMIWNKRSCPFPSNVRYSGSFEYMFVLSKGKPKTINLLSDRKNKWAGIKMHGTERGKNGKTKHTRCHKREVKEYGVRWNIWDVSAPGLKDTEHPATFPVGLAEDHIMSWSSENNIIMDPLMGSGTTGVAAKKLNRKFLGIEKDKKYFEIAKKRINNHDR